MTYPLSQSVAKTLNDSRLPFFIVSPFNISMLARDNRDIIQTEHTINPADMTPFRR